MQVTELIKRYASDSFDRMVIPELYRKIDATDLNTNVHTIPQESDSDEVRECEMLFEKFAGETYPGYGTIPYAETSLTEEGEELGRLNPRDFGDTIENTLYERFTDSVDTATYFGENVSAIENAIDTFESARNYSADTIIIHSTYLTDEERDGLDSRINASILESNSVLPNEFLITNDRFGYFGVRTEVDTNSYVLAEIETGITEPDVNHPLVVQFFTRIGTVEANPEKGMRFVPIGEANRNI